MSKSLIFHVVGPDGIKLGLNEIYDSKKDVENNPYGAWLAIQNLWSLHETLEHYRKTFCEGEFCGSLDETHCSGCRAARALRGEM